MTLQAAIPMTLDFVHPLNFTRPKRLCIHAEYYIDQQKYFWYLFFVSIIHTFLCAVVTIATDASYVSCTQHLLALFDIIG